MSLLDDWKEILMQEKLGVMPGERSGELQLLSPGEAPVKVAAAPQNVPLPSKPKAEGYEDGSQSSSPFLASSSALLSGTTALWRSAFRSKCRVL